MTNLFQDAYDLIHRGGLAMAPILAMSVLSLAIVLDRAWYLFSCNSPSARRVAADMARHLRAGRTREALTLAQSSDTPYAGLVRAMLVEGKPTEALAAEALETQEGRIFRGLVFLSTTVTAAPMLGLLGTVWGVIKAFSGISAGTQAGGAVNLQALSGGIGEALIATASGIGVALLVLVPYNLLRAKAERTVAHLETLAQAAIASVQPA